MNINIGDEFGHWTVVDDKEQMVHRKNGNLVGYLCECDCHNKTRKIVDKYSLFSGHSKSCGCTRRKTHGMSHTKFYQQYYGMIKRCELKSHKEYADYGGRGIKVCEEWRNDFQLFYDWAMQNGYENGLTIERIDVNGNYEPSNCRWVTKEEQANNKRNNIILTYKERTMNAKEWAKQDDVHIPYGTILRRFHDGWSTEDILFKEVRKR